MGNSFVDISGRTFGRLFVTPHHERRGNTRTEVFWLCKCSCGIEKMIRSRCLVRPRGQQSCGCLQREWARARWLTHGESFGAEWRLWNSAKNRAKRHNVPFTIRISDVVIPERCPLLGIKLIHGVGTTLDCSPSLDRRVPARGYVPGNVQVVSHKANTIKNNATVEELERIVEGLRRAI